MSDSKQEDYDRVKKACEALGEHFDSVQIFASRYDGGNNGTTRSVDYGTGNWFARKGQVTEWVGAQDEYNRQKVRQDNEDV